MKTHKWFGWALAAIMTGASFTACTNETEEVFAQSNEIKLTSAITPASRVANQLLQSTQIVENQEVGVTFTGAKSDHNNVKWIAQEDGSLRNTNSSPLYWGNTNVEITAYHPFNSNWGTDTEPTFSVNTDQSENENYLNSDLLWVNTTASKSTNPIELKFAHKLSKIMVGLQHEETETDVTSAIISICGTKTTATFDLSSGTVTASGSVADIKAAETASAAAIIIPQTVNAGTKFIKVEFNGKTFYYTLSENKTFEAGKAYDFTLTLKEKGTELTLTSPESEGNITDWNNENNSTTGDANEEETGNTPAAGTVVIENYELSEALYNILGSSKVQMSNGYAVMDENYVATITDLNFQNYEGDITNLSGIEKFANLEYLDCGSRTSLTDCDLSQNTKLKSFAVTESSLTSLDFSNNNLLKAVHCNGNEQLSSLNVTGCTQLSNLQIFSTALTTSTLIIPDEVKASVDNLLYSGTSLELDLNEFPKLESLGCTNMNLTTLEGYIPESYKSRLTVLMCDNNQLTEVDLDEYPNLRTLSCYNNEIQELDPSKAPHLQNLSCFGNKISTLDISSNLELTDWRCGNQTSSNNNESITIRVTVNSTQQSAYNNGLKEWGNENINLILAE